MTFERARAIADAVLLEGYVLYPYRPTALKNRYRWTFGVLAPKVWSESGGCEPSFLEAQVLVLTKEPALRVRLRFLRVLRRILESDGKRVASLEVDGTVLHPWEEGVLSETDVDLVGDARIELSFPERQTSEPVVDAAGNRVGTVVRDLHRLSVTLQASFERLSNDLTRVGIRVENGTDFARGAPRADAIRASLASTHLLLFSKGASFASVRVSSTETAPFLASTRSIGTYPVLVDDERRDIVLCSPIVLDEPPQIAPESPGDFFDSGEIDELLVLRTQLLTPEEKALARSADPRTRELVDRVEDLSDEARARLHGTIRDRPAPTYAPGARVRLCPARSGRRTDAQDLLYEGLEATVQEVLDDVDGRKYLAVTIDGDPAAELHQWYGRFLHYYPDEVEPLTSGEARP